MFLQKVEAENHTECEQGGEYVKVLLSAYACEPNRGSEAADGWHWAKQMARFHDVWVITRANNKKVIEGEIDHIGLDHVHWLYVDLPRWARFWKRGAIGTEIYYFLWQLMAYLYVKHTNRREQFDLVHHVTFGRYWVPSFMSLLPIPFVWGPVGGGEETPSGFLSTFSTAGWTYELFRSKSRFVAHTFPFLRLTAKRAKISFATTSQTADKLSRLGARKVVVHPQYFLEKEQLDYFGKFPVRTQKPVRFLSMGRLVHWKGHHLALQAFAKAVQSCPDCEYWLTSDGPERKRLEHLAEKLDIADRVRFWGHLPSLHDVYEKLAQSDVLLHPALHEAFGNACLEALAAGRPTVYRFPP